MRESDNGDQTHDAQEEQTPPDILSAYRKSAERIINLFDKLGETRSEINIIVDGGDTRLRLKREEENDIRYYDPDGSEATIRRTININASLSTVGANGIVTASRRDNETRCVANMQLLASEPHTYNLSYRTGNQEGDQVLLNRNGHLVQEAITMKKISGITIKRNTPVESIDATIVSQSQDVINKINELLQDEVGRRQGILYDRSLRGKLANGWKYLSALLTPLLSRNSTSNQGEDVKLHP